MNANTFLLTYYLLQFIMSVNVVISRHNELSESHCSRGKEKSTRRSTSYITSSIHSRNHRQNLSPLPNIAFLLSSLSHHLLPAPQSTPVPPSHPVAVPPSHPLAVPHSHPALESPFLSHHHQASLSLLFPPSVQPSVLLSPQEQH